MKIAIKPLLPTAGILLLIFSISCQGDETPAPPSASKSTTTGPTPVPQQAKDLALEFYKAHDSIEEDWDQFHADFDLWRKDLVACDPSAARQAFQGFAGQFNDVKEKTLSLSRPSGVRGLADKLIEASQEEAAALRRLRDNWQPGDTLLLEAVASKRVASAAAQKKVEDKLVDLQEGTDAESDADSMEELAEFSTSFDALQASWEMIHSSYEQLKIEQERLEPEVFTARIDELVGSFDVILLGVASLPSADQTDDLAEALSVAADSQKKGLQELESLEPDLSRTPAFDAFDGYVKESKNVLQDTKKELKSLTGDGSGDDTAAVQDFDRDFKVLLVSWNQFHGDFDDWMDSGGDCDRAEVIQTLGDFSLEFGGLADQARDLPTASYLRPMGGLVVVAAEGEAEALRVLRNTWRPFGADAYKALDQERANAGRLRRQAAVGVQELLDRFQVPTDDTTDAAADKSADGAKNDKAPARPAVPSQ